MKRGHDTRQLVCVITSHAGIRHGAPVMIETRLAVHLQPQARARVIDQWTRQRHGDPGPEDAKEISLQREASGARVVAGDVRHRRAEIDDHAKAPVLGEDDVAANSVEGGELPGEGHRGLDAQQ